MIKNNKKNKAIKNSEIFIYFSIALVTVVLMLIAPMLNKSIYAKSSTLPASFEKGKALQNAITKESGETLQNYMKVYENSQSIASSYYTENARYLHNKGIEKAYVDDNKYSKYEGPVIDNHKNFLPEGYFWDNSGQAIRNILGSGNTESVNFAKDLLNPYAGILCFYEGLRLPSGSQISAEMFKGGLRNVPAGKVLNDYIFKDNSVFEKIKAEVSKKESKGAQPKDIEINSTVKQPDFELNLPLGGAANYFGGVGMSLASAATGGKRKEGLNVQTTNGLLMPTPIVKADEGAVSSAWRQKEQNDKDSLNDLLNGNSFGITPKPWTSIYLGSKAGGKATTDPAYKYTNKIAKSGETDEEHDGLYEDITGGHQLTTSTVVAKTWSFPALMAQQNTSIWGEDNFVQSVVTQIKKEGDKGVDSLQGPAWQSAEVDHVQHPNNNTTAEGNKKKAAQRLFINAPEAKRLSEFVRQYEDYQDKFNNWISKNQRDIENWNTDGNTAKVVNSRVEPQLRYILPKNFHKDREIPNSNGQLAPNPKIQYQPKIESAQVGKSIQEVSKVKFDKNSQKWLVGPYKLKYFKHELKDKVRADRANEGKIVSDITEIQLFGVYDNGTKYTQDKDPNKADPNSNSYKDKIDPDRFGTQRQDANYSHVKSWSFITKKGTLEKSAYPEPDEDFYIAVDYDPALRKIAKARFVFGYMVQGTEYTKIVGTYNIAKPKKKDAVKNVKIGEGKTTTREKYDVVPGTGGQTVNYSPGPVISTGAPVFDQARNYMPLNGNMFGRFYSLGGAGSATTPAGTVPLPQTAGYGNYNEQYGTRVPPTANEHVNITWEVTYNIEMQTITILEKGAGRWGEEIALEIEFDQLDSTTEPAPNGPRKPRDTQLRLPIGGTVWEDTIKDNKKHTGYNNLLDKGSEKGIAGVRVRIHRNFVELNANKSVKRIIRKEVARVYRRDTGELVDITANPIITDENGNWGGFDIHDVGFNTRELQEMGGVSNSKNYAILFDVTFDFDGIMYEPVMPLQTEENNIDNGKKVNTEVFKDGQSIYNTTTTEEKKKYLNSSFAIENYADREEYNRKHAEITGGKEQDGSLNTQGSAQGVDANGTRNNIKTKLDYKGTQTTSGTTTQRFKSDYQMKKTNGRALDEAYFNDFIEASTMFLGINLPTNEQIVYDNNGYYDDRTGGNSNITGSNAASNNGSGVNRFANNVLNKLGNTGSLNGANGILPSNNGLNNRNGGNAGSWWNNIFGGAGNRVISNAANNSTLWGKIQNAGVKASEVLEQVIGYGKLTGALLDDLVDLGAIKKNPIEKVLSKVDKATNTLRTMIEKGLVSGQKIDEIIKNGGSKAEIVTEILKETRVSNKLSDWIEKKTGIRVDIEDDRIPTNYPDNMSIEDMVADMKNRGLVLYENGLNINTAAAQAKTGKTAEQINEEISKTLGLKVKTAANTSEVSWQDVVKGQTGKYAGTVLGELGNNGKVSGSSLEKAIDKGALAASIIDDLAKTGSININVAGFDINVNKDVKDMLNQVLSQSGVAGSTISDLLNNGKVDISKVWEGIYKEGGIDLGKWENLIKDGKHDNLIWKSIGGSTGGNSTGEATDESVDGSYGQYAGVYYSQRSYMNEINLGLKRRHVDMETTKELNSALVIANKKAYNYLYKTLYDEYLSDAEKAKGLGRTIDVNMEDLQKGRDANKTQRFLDIYKTDYIYRTSMYTSNPEVLKLLKEEIDYEKSLDKSPKNTDPNRGNHDDTRQVDVFLTYKIQVINSSPVDAVYISQLNDIHTNKMELVQTEIKKEVQLDPNTNIEKEGIDLKGTQTTIPVSKYLIHGKEEPISKLDLSQADQAKLKELKWSTSNDRVPAQSGDYTTTQTEGTIENAGFMLKPGERADVFNTYRVKNALQVQNVSQKDLGELKDKIGKEDGIKVLKNALELGDFTNVAEIGAFASYNVHTGTYSGKIDRDSAPSNFTTNKAKDGKFVLEDDTDDAPGINIRIPEGAKEKVSRELTGTVWEDKQNTLNRGILTGDGKMTSNEKGIPNQPVTLEERLSFKARQIDDKPNLRYADVRNGLPYFDLGFVWPEQIKSETGDIEMSLKGVTGFESNVKTNEKGEYKFTGVPAGNFVVSLNYSSPSKENLTKVFADKNNQGRNILNAVQNAAISRDELVETVKDDNKDRKVKWYNGESFKTTQFYANDKQESNLNTTWLAKDKDENKDTQIVSYARDDEGRRVQVTKNIDTFKNNVVDTLNVFTTADRNSIDNEKLKLAHTYTSMNATTPKINFSIEYYEKLQKSKPGSAVILNELSDIYYIEGIYKNKQNANNKFENTDYNVKNVNLGIVQRPESKIVLNKEITNIVINTADGQETINLKYNIKSKIDKAEVANLNNVNYGGHEELYARLKVSRELDTDNSKGQDLVLSLDRTELTDGKAKDENQRKSVKSGFRYINIDDSVMQNATIKVRYGIYAYNLSQLDRTIDTSIEDTNKYREEAYKTGMPDEPAQTLGRLAHQGMARYNYGKYVGPEYYIAKGNTPLTENEKAKIKIRQLLDIVDNGATVNAGDAENAAWTAANKADLKGLINGVKNDETAKEANYVDENGIRYIEEVSNKQNSTNNNTRSNLLVLKESSTYISPVDPYATIERVYKNQNGYANSPKEDDFVRTWNIRTDRTSSGSSTSNDLTFQNMAEVLSYHTSNGRRTEFTPGMMITEMDKVNQLGDGTLPGKGKPGNITSKENNLDRAYMVAAESTGASATEIVTLSPPTGLNEARTLEYIRKNALLIASSVAVVLTTTVVIVMIVRKRQK